MLSVVAKAAALALLVAIRYPQRESIL